MPIHEAVIFQCDACGTETTETLATLHDEERELPEDWEQADTGEILCADCATTALADMEPRDPDQVDIDPDTIPDHGLDY